MSFVIFSGLLQQAQISSAKSDVNIKHKKKQHGTVGWYKNLPIKGTVTFCFI